LRSAGGKKRRTCMALSYTAGDKLARNGRKRKTGAIIPRLCDGIGRSTIYPAIFG
jgi:hypothetical protein